MGAECSVAWQDWDVVWKPDLTEITFTHEYRSYSDNTERSQSRPAADWRFQLHGAEWGRADEDMLRCQEVLPEGYRNYQEWYPYARRSIMNDADSKAAEEAKRERNWDPVKRWKTIQETIAWVEAQAKEPRNSKANRLLEQAEKEKMAGPTSS